MSNIYQLALDVQDASNIQGVINSLANEVLPAIRLEPGYTEQGTRYVAHHPVVLLFLDKIVSLAEGGWISYVLGKAEHDFTWAYNLCREHVAAEAAAIADRNAPATEDGIRS